MIIGVPREVVSDERRVALTPDSVRKLVEAGVEVHVESGAGVASACPDPSYQEAGAKIQPGPQEIFANSDVVVRVQPPTKHPSTGQLEIEGLRQGACWIGLIYPFIHLDETRRLAEKGITSFALDLMPRITRAQSMDVLSSMSTIAGYKAVLTAGNALPKLFPMLMTAAGTLKPARVLILGAGVAGLQAIATARRLGAVVEAFDIRAAAKEQVESLGARFVEDEEQTEDAEGAGGYAKEQTAEQLERQRQLLSKHMAESDVVICTALVPGRPAPRLMTEDQVQGMSPGSLIVDLAAEQGGNCECTKPGEIINVHGVEIHGPVNVASSVPVHASQMFSRNLTTFLLHLIDEGQLKLDLEDEVTSGPLLTHEGQIVHEAVKSAAGS